MVILVDFLSLKENLGGTFYVLATRPQGAVKSGRNDLGKVASGPARRALQNVLLSIPLRRGQILTKS